MTQTTLQAIHDAAHEAEINGAVLGDDRQEPAHEPRWLYGDTSEWEQDCKAAGWPSEKC